MKPTDGLRVASSLLLLQSFYNFRRTSGSILRYTPLMNQRIVPVMAAVLLWIEPRAFSHPGSAIIVDPQGNVYFTHSGRGVGKIDPQGNLTYILLNTCRISVRQEVKERPKR